MARKLKLDLSRIISRFAWDMFYKRQKSNLCIPVLVYHRVLPELIEDDHNPVYTVLPKEFEAHLAFLIREGFTSLSLKEFGEMVQGLRPPMQRGVVITFDDGYADNYAVAWPLAQKYGIKLNFFVSTGIIGEPRPVIMTSNGYHVHNKVDRRSFPYQEHIKRFSQLWRPLSWQELGEMSQAETNLGLHGHSHRNLAFLSREEIIRDINAGTRVFQEKLGYRPEVLSLPYGGHEINTDNLFNLLKKMGCAFIFTTIKGRVSFPCKDFVFPRISILQQDSLEDFRLKLLGAYDWLGSLEKLVHMIKGLLSEGVGEKIE